MKKIFPVITVVLVIIAIFSILNVSGEMPLRIVVNGDRLFFPDAQPFIDANGRTQTPARFIGEELGATVTWDGAAQKATFVKGSKVLNLYIGKKEYELDGKKLQMDTAALLQEGRTFVPARYVAEAFGETVRWDSVIRTVYIDTNVVAVPTPQATKDPVYGWIKVETDKEYVEYSMSITWTADNDLLNQRYDAAEKMFADKYGKDISTQVFAYVRLKKTRQDKIEMKEFKYKDQIITVFGADAGVEIKVWKKEHSCN
ncbi:MAG: hypothetical protein BWY74_00545 [Firmicutes bacterium ADurb.Bin419]|nr:MAG: hypothetical protein BWY74_00545 [Firmicutes bacterium ADurb.Bin419]